MSETSSRRQDSQQLVRQWALLRLLAESGRSWSVKDLAEQVGTSKATIQRDLATLGQEFALVEGHWKVRGEPVRPQDIKNTALLTVEGELDDISGAGQTEAAHSLCTGIAKTRQRHYMVKGAGHYGIFSGRRWREMAYPEIAKFIAQHHKD